MVARTRLIVTLYSTYFARLIHKSVRCSPRDLDLTFRPNVILFSFFLILSRDFKETNMLTLERWAVYGARSVNLLSSLSLPVVTVHLFPSLKCSILDFVRITCYSLTHSMMQSPSWEANRFSASQEIPRILWNPKGHYRIHNSPTTCPYPQPHQSSPYPHIPIPEDHHHHHKYQGLDPLIRSVCKVTTALSNVSSVFKLFSFLVVCSNMISKDSVLWHSLQVLKPVPSVFIYIPEDPS